MESNLIVERIKQLLEKTYPNEPVYVDQLPQDFERPSFLLEAVKREVKDVNIGLIQVTLTLKITCFSAVDEYGDCSREELNQRMDGVQSLFCSGTLAVDDRALKITSVPGAGEIDFAAVTVTLSYVDSRPGYHDPDSDQAVMEHYTLNEIRKD